MLRSSAFFPRTLFVISLVLLFGVVTTASASNRRVLCYNESTDKAFIKRKCKKNETKISNVEQYAQLFPGAVGVAGIAGADGPQGPAGPKGSTGATGSAGAQGAQGATGDSGPDGLPGNQGVDGNPGGQGPQGIPGNDGGSGVVHARVVRASNVNCNPGTPSVPAQCAWGHSCPGGNNRPIAIGCWVSNPTENFKYLGAVPSGNGVSCRFSNTGSYPPGQFPFLVAYVICGGSIPFPQF